MESEERPSKKRRISNDEHLEATKPADVLSETVDANDQISNGHRGDATPEIPQNGTSVNENSQTQTERHDASAADPEESNSNTLPPPDTTAPMLNSLLSNKSNPPISKNQQKKLRKQLDWESKRDERKTIRKQKVVAKRERKRAARDQAIENGDLPLHQPPSERQKSVQLPVTILIDCDFDDLMREPERKSLAAQITRSYSDTRKAPFRSHLAVCSFGGALRKRFDEVLTHYKSWKGVRFLDCDFVEAAGRAGEWMGDAKVGDEMGGVFSKYPSDSEAVTKLQEEAEVVYLTSESDYTLTELKPYSTYIIGGLVDKNREKGICYKRATQRGIKTARLPIGEFMDMQSRKVLATNHVNEIMVRWLECGDWGEAFVKVIPKRKGGKLKEGGGDHDGGGGEEGEDEGSEKAAGTENEVSEGDVDEE